jgi:hypothetical protein
LQNAPIVSWISWKFAPSGLWPVFVPSTHTRQIPFREAERFQDTRAGPVDRFARPDQCGERIIVSPTARIIMPFAMAWSLGAQPFCGE